MRCIFCKADSQNSRSKEHIIPESLGNKEHILPPGWVCDSCNNYFSRKIEAPFLESWYGTSSRFEMGIPNKKGRIPIGTGFHPHSRLKVNIMVDKNGISIFAAQDEDETHFIKSISTQRKGSIYIPSAGIPELSYETARFIGKVGLEIFAHRCIDLEGWNDEIVDKTELDALRNYVRRGKPGFIWPVNIRKIYPADNKFLDEKDKPFEVLHEWDILYIPTSKATKGGEFYAIIAILGVEYAINLGGPAIDGYLNWLEKHNDQSYLYIKNEE